MAHKFSLNFKQSWITRKGPNLIQENSNKSRGKFHPGRQKCYKYVVKDENNAKSEHLWSKCGASPSSESLWSCYNSEQSPDCLRVQPWKVQPALPLLVVCQETPKVQGGAGLWLLGLQNAVQGSLQLSCLPTSWL